MKEPRVESVEDYTCIGRNKVAELTFCLSDSENQISPISHSLMTHTHLAICINCTYTIAHAIHTHTPLSRLSHWPSLEHKLKSSSTI